MTFVSASSLPRVFVCAASAVLPQANERSDAAEEGTIKHAYLRNCRHFGPKKSLEMVPDEYRDTCAMIDLSALPPLDEKWLTEAAYAYDTKAKTARFLGCDLERNYPKTEKTEVTGTADIARIHDKKVTVYDYKSGAGTGAAKAHTNIQLKFLALAIARAHGLHEAEVGLIYIDQGCRYDIHAMDALDLDVFESDLVKSIAKVGYADSDVRRGKIPWTTPGPHCRYCPALPSCPSHRTLLATLAGADPDELWYKLEPVSDDTAIRAYVMIKAIKESLARAERSVYAYAATHELTLPGGGKLGSVEHTSERLDGKIAIEKIREKYGDKTALAVIGEKVTKTAIKAALRDWCEENGGKITKEERSLLEAIESAGGIKSTTTTSVKEH